MTNAEIDAIIAANPDDPKPYLVYADWLTARGDPRGSLIVAQHALMQNPQSDDLQREVLLILEEHRGRLLPDRPYFQRDLSSSKTDPHPRLEWHLGFLRSALITYDDGYGGAAEEIAALLSHASGRFLRRLTLGDLDPGGDYRYDATIEFLGGLARPRTLRALDLGDVTSYEPLASGTLEDVSVIRRAIPDIEELSVAGVLGNTYGEVGADFSLDHVRVLSLRPYCATEELLQGLSASSWPRLERFELWLGRDFESMDIKVADTDAVRSFLASPALGSIHHLALMNASHADALPAAVPSTAILGRLQSLDFSAGCMTDDGAKAILRQHEAFSHLSRLVLCGNFISEAVAAELRERLPNVDVTGQRSGAPAPRYFEEFH